MDGNNDVKCAYGGGTGYRWQASPTAATAGTGMYVLKVNPLLGCPSQFSFVNVSPII